MLALMSRRPLLRRTLLVVLALLLALVAAAWLAMPTPKEYDVVSIKEDARYQGDEALTRAWSLEVARAYKPAVQYQHNPSVCGPTSLANVITSLGGEATPRSVIEGSGYCWTGYCIPGVTLEELAEIAREKLPGAQVEVIRDLSLEEFREHLRRSNDPSLRYTVNFLRGPLFRTGGGHHSPIAGYLEQEDLVLVLDVNESFGPWLVESERLFAAIDTIDPATEKKRGLLRITPPAS